MEFILYVSTYFVTINQPLWFRRSTTIVQPTCIQSPLVPVWVGADRRNEQLQCLNHVGKPNFCELQTDSTRTTGKVRQIAKKIVLMLEASTASYLCICGLMLSMLLPSRQGKLLIKRIGKNRATRISYTELFRNVVDNFYFTEQPLDFCLCVSCWWQNWSDTLQYGPA